jgi:UDP-N-acetyl-D-glucosamine dehydrogenase
MDLMEQPGAATEAPKLSLPALTKENVSAIMALESPPPDAGEADLAADEADIMVAVNEVAAEPEAQAGGAKTPAELLINALEKLGAVVTWNDPVVGSWHGKDSVGLGGVDIAVVVTKHDVVSAAEILKSAPYVFDTTGKVKGAVQL